MITSCKGIQGTPSWAKFATKVLLSVVVLVTLANNSVSAGSPSEVDRRCFVDHMYLKGREIIWCAPDVFVMNTCHSIELILQPTAADEINLAIHGGKGYRRIVGCFHFRHK
ncbi:hypothetical protein BGX28_004073 [Mortierella sp. GBA30]|nr:hypothetical protein BGX28_004073 [Mortierella sp. GBA30]